MPENQPKSKLIAIVGGGIVLLLLLTVIGLPFLVDASAFRPILISELSTPLGRLVTVDHLKLSIFSGGLTAEGFSIADDPAFSHDPFIRAKSVKVRVRLLPLIFSRLLYVEGITIEHPQVSLIQSNGLWNYSSLGNRAFDTASVGSAHTPAPSGPTHIGSFRISGARFSITETSKHPIVLDNVDLEMKGISTTSALPFSLTANLAGGGTLELSGTQGPLNSSDTAATPFDAVLKIRRLDLVSSGLLDPSAGIAAIANLDSTVTQKVDSVQLAGKLTAENWKIATNGSAAKTPLEFDFTVAHKRARQSGDLTRGEIRLGKALATLTGHYDLHGATPAVNFTLAASSLPGSEIAPTLPAMDVVLPAGATLEGGTVSANLNASGPLDRLVTTGSVGLSNVRLTNFDLGSKLQTLQALAGIKPTSHTEIQTLSLNLQSSPDSTSLDGIRIVIPTLGELTGAGVISSSHALDFKMGLTPAKSGGMVPVLGGVGTIPFMVSGTAQNPKFVPDVGAIAAGRIVKIADKNPAVKSLLKGLFGGRKK